MLPGAWYGESFLIKKVFNPENKFHIPFSVLTLTRRSSLGLDSLEFSFPETENMGRQPDKLRDFPNLKAKFVRD